MAGHWLRRGAALRMARWLCCSCNRATRASSLSCRPDDMSYPPQKNLCSSLIMTKQVAESDACETMNYTQGHTECIVEELRYMISRLHD